MKVFEKQLMMIIRYTTITATTNTNNNNNNNNNINKNNETWKNCVRFETQFLDRYEKSFRLIRDLKIYLFHVKVCCSYSYVCTYVSDFNYSARA